MKHFLSVFLEQCFQLTLFDPGGGAQIPQPAQTRKYQWVWEILIIFVYSLMLGVFHGQKTFSLVGRSLSWSETPYFHKGGPL